MFCLCVFSNPYATRSVKLKRMQRRRKKLTKAKHQRRAMTRTRMLRRTPKKRNQPQRIPPKALRPKIRSSSRHVFLFLIFVINTKPNIGFLHIQTSSAIITKRMTVLKKRQCKNALLWLLWWWRIHYWYLSVRIHEVTVSKVIIVQVYNSTVQLVKYFSSNGSSELQKRNQIPVL